MTAIFQNRHPINRVKFQRFWLSYPICRFYECSFLQLLTSTPELYLLSLNYEFDRNNFLFHFHCFDQWLQLCLMRIWHSSRCIWTVPVVDLMRKISLLIFIKSSLSKEFPACKFYVGHALQKSAHFPGFQLFKFEALIWKFSLSYCFLVFILF